MGTESTVNQMSGQTASREGPDRHEAVAPVVLVVEDEVLVRMSVSEQLRNQGFNVIEAHDADEAVQVLQTRSDIDVVFTDTVMPGKINGADLALTWLREHKPGIPVLLTSGVVQGRLSTGGVRRIVPKPYDMDALVRELRALISSHKAALTA